MQTVMAIDSDKWEILGVRSGGLMLTMEGVAVSKKRRKAKLNRPDAVPAPAPFVPDIAIPASARSSSVNEPCQQCGEHWRGMKLSRDLGDGTSEPVRYAAFEVVKWRPALGGEHWHQIFEGDENGEVRKVWDCPRLYPRNGRVNFTEVWFRRWLCGDCYAAAEAMGWDAWAREVVWAESVREDAAEQRFASLGRNAPTAMEMAIEGRRVDEDGKEVGVMVAETELPDWPDDVRKRAVMLGWLVYSMR
jgi:hypothetical protein